MAHLEPERKLRHEPDDDDVIKERLPGWHLRQPFGQTRQQLPLVSGWRDQAQPILVNKVDQPARAAHNVPGHHHSVAKVGDGRCRLR
jgi:hypothetical protein